MRGTRGQTERPYEPLLQLGSGARKGLCRIGGSPRSGGASFRGGILEIPPCRCLAGSLTGAVASQSVTEARDGGLRPVGHRLLECKGTSPPDCERDGASRDESR